jgi:hypothetical protein
MIIRKPKSFTDFVEGYYLQDLFIANNPQNRRYPYYIVYRDKHYNFKNWESCKKYISSLLAPVK